MKLLLIILFLITLYSCTTAVSNDPNIYCTEALKKGDRIMVYWSEYPGIINTDIKLNIDGYDGFYILELSKSKKGWHIESQKYGLINFEDGIVSLLNGC